MIEISKSFPKFITMGGKQKKLPMHLAVSTSSVKEWAEENKKEYSEAIKRHFSAIDELIDYQLKNQIRVLTITLIDTSPEMVEALKEYFTKIHLDERINKNQMRVFVMGQWYELDTDLSDMFKLAMEKTRLYDNFFLNFCIKYSGREELLGSLRLMVRKILSGKLKEEDLTEDMIKENIYSSYFPPPELILECMPAYSGTLLWDSKGAVIKFAESKWPALEKRELDDAVSFYDRNINKDA